METEDALAAGQGGIESTLAQQSPTSVQENQSPQQEDASQPEEDKAEPVQAPGDPLLKARRASQRAARLHDEAQRRRVADRLEDLLDINVGLAELCGREGESPRAGCTEAAHASAHISQASARLGLSLAQLLKVERRQISIVHHTQPRQQHSNSNAPELTEEETRLFNDLNGTLWRYMKLVADEELVTALDPETRRKKYGYGV